MKVNFVEKLEDSLVYIFASSNFGACKDSLRDISSDDYASYIINDCRDLRYKDYKVYDVYRDGSLRKIILVGAGEAGKINRSSIEKLGGSIYSAVQVVLSSCSKDVKRDARISVWHDIDFVHAANYIVSGIMLKSYVFDKYKTKKNDFVLSHINCLSRDIDSDTLEHNNIVNLRDSVCFTRDLVNEPANVVYPQSVVDKVSGEFSSYGISVKVLDRNEMVKLGMNALLGVAQGSNMAPYTLICEYVSDPSLPRVALVGKGVTFDSGGISIKPSNNMAEMKGDMAGSAVVLGAIRALALNNVACNVIAAVGLVENMPSGSAQRPGDVVTAMNGVTVEVDNTDAEGRLVLADVLSYVTKNYEPSTIIDVATLTGAIGVALGKEYAGLFSNNDLLCDRLMDSSRETGEKIWRLPTHDSYDNDIKSNIADIKNVGSGNGGGSITAAKFLEHFINKDKAAWAHIDIAYTEWCSCDLSLSQKGATGFGVRLLYDFCTRKVS